MSFENPKDAQEAVRVMHKAKVENKRLLVEIKKPKSESLANRLSRTSVSTLSLLNCS